MDPQSISTISRYMEYAVKAGLFSGDPNEYVSKYAAYSDPLIETILYNSKSEIEAITGKELFPTYSYARVYVKGDELEPHTDRPSCEISATVHVATTGKPWPIWMQSPGRQAEGFVLEVGDAVVYKGCVVKHWRDPAVETEINAQFMLHYVDKAGPNASFKFDGREGLGFKVRRM